MRDLSKQGSINIDLTAKVITKIDETAVLITFIKDMDVYMSTNAPRCTLTN
jgi:hypothetical protein